MATAKEFRNNVIKNLRALEEIKKNNPSTTHVYMRRCDKDNLVVDIPIGQTEATIRQRPAWKVVSSNKQMDDDVEKLFKEPAKVKVPLRPSEKRKRAIRKKGKKQHHGKDPNRPSVYSGGS